MSQYPHLYNSAAWKRIRKAHLLSHPLCVMCKPRGIVQAATVVDHIEPHRGDAAKFYAGPFQALCKGCHDSLKQTEEKRGHNPMVGLDGWPMDTKHPINRKTGHAG